MPTNEMPRVIFAYPGTYTEPNRDDIGEWDTFNGGGDGTPYVRESVLLTEREAHEEYLKALPTCDEHRPNGGSRSQCVICAQIKLAAALSRIDYLSGQQNEMEVSSYDLHCDEQEVVRHVEKLIEAHKREVEGLKREIEELKEKLHPTCRDVQEFYQTPPDPPQEVKP